MIDKVRLAAFYLKTYPLRQLYHRLEFLATFWTDDFSRYSLRFRKSTVLEAFSAPFCSNISIIPQFLVV